MEPRKRGRPRVHRETKNVTLSMDPDLWESLKEKALEMGYSTRTQFLTAIARGEITLEQLSAELPEAMECGELPGEQSAT